MWDEQFIQKALSVTQAGFDRSDQVEDFASGFHKGLHPFEAEAIRQYLKKPSRVLVLGCGAGRECFALAQLGHPVTGLDSSPRMLEKAQELCRRSEPPIRFVRGDVTELSADLGSFDAVILSDNIYAFLPSQQLRRRTLRQAARLLAAEGILLVFVGWLAEKRNPFYHNALVTSLRTLKRRLFDPPLREAGDALLKLPRAEEVGYFHFFQRPDDIASEFRQAGFDILYQEYFAWVLQPCAKP